MEPPSRQLVELLSRFALATSADLRRCRSQVRRLAHDLPTFDSVWIDALTQARVITPFQAKFLESEQPHLLQVGPCVLVDEWEKDGRWTLRLAKHRSNGQRCLLTFVDVPSNELPKAVQQARCLIAKLRETSHPSIVVPQGCDQADDRLVVVSPYITGPTLKQLLVRRGRFPIPVVTDIAWQLIDGLAALEECGVVHGDLTLTSIRLTERGQVVLLHPGVMPAVGNRVSIHAPLSPDNYDGTAPELISTGKTATPHSDLYAVGCLLWQLLAGRPPFPTGDPLAKLAAHQTKAIDDVRRWVPDASPKLAELIKQLTAKKPDARGGGAKSIRDAWPLESRLRRQRLAQFHSSFGTVAPRHGDVHRSASKFPLTAAAMMLFLLSGVSLALLDAGARNELLRLAGRTTNGTVLELTGHQRDQPSDEDIAPTTDRQEKLSFPSRAVDGVIELTSAGPYSAAEVQVEGPLTIRGASGVTPVVSVRAHPLRLSATQVTIEGVRFVQEGGKRHAQVLVAIQSQRAVIDRCCFETDETTATGSVDSEIVKTTSSAVAWKVADTDNPTGGKLLMRNTVMTGPMHALATHTMPRSIAIDNCLKAGSGVFIRMAHQGSEAPLRVHLRQTTLRESGGVIRWSPTSAEQRLQPLLLVVENCVFDIPPTSGALLEFAAKPPSGWERLVRVTGEGSSLPATAVLAAMDVEGATQPHPIETRQLRMEGLLIDEFEFAGQDSRSVAESVIASSQAPRNSPIPPGIDPAPLTSQPTAPLVRHAAGP